MKPKEWYLNPVCKYKCDVNESGIGLTGNEIHVIENSGYDKAIEALKLILHSYHTAECGPDECDCHVSIARNAIQELGVEP